jgi:hypothetical protein
MTRPKRKTTPRMSYKGKGPRLRTPKTDIEMQKLNRLT